MNFLDDPLVIKENFCLTGEANVTVSLVWPTLCLFEQELLKQEEADTQLTKDVKRRIVSYLYEKYISDPQCENMMKVATYLDPRFKSHYGDKRREVLDEMESFNPPSTEPLTDMVVTEETGGSSKKRKLSDFFKSSQSKERQTDLNKSELDLYEKSPQVDDKSINVLAWWKENETVYPTVCKVALKYLCVPATSVPSERVFSCAGTIVTDRRTCLKPEKVNQLIFLNQNL